MAEKENVWFQKLVKYIPLVVIAIIFLIILGIILLCKEQKTTREHIIDYTYCLNDENERCYDLLPSNYLCRCMHSFNLTEPFHGEILFYYELDSFDQSNNEYQMSRDNNQLMGNLLEEPSESCEPYRYKNISGKLVPIAPCGKIADTFFRDDFVLKYVDKDLDVPLLPEVLSEQEKVGFANPKNLSELDTFAAPTGWPDNWNLTVLDSTHPNNNAFRNNRLIGWMNTDLKRKPMAKLNQKIPPFENGLEKGIYEMKIIYTYHRFEPYNGTRSLIVTSVETHNTSFIFGAVSLALGLVLLTISLSMIVSNYKRGLSNEDTKADKSKEQTSPELNPLRATATN